MNGNAGNDGTDSTGNNQETGTATNEVGAACDEVLAVGSDNLPLVIFEDGSTMERTGLLDIYENGRNGRPKGIPQTFLDLCTDISEFHTKFVLDYHGRPRALPADLASFRHGFDLEEAHEWERANRQALMALGSDALQLYGDDYVLRCALADQLDAVVDQLYVLLGKAHLQGFTPAMIAEAWSRVHAKNMEKERCVNEGDSTRKSTYDVIKPQGWTPASHLDLVVPHAHPVTARVKRD